MWEKHDLLLPVWEGLEIQFASCGGGYSQCQTFRAKSPKPKLFLIFC